MMVEHINGIPGPELIHHLFMYNCMYYKVHTKCICTPHKRRHSFTQTSFFRWYHMQFTKIIQKRYGIQFFLENNKGFHGFLLLNFAVLVLHYSQEKVSCKRTELLLWLDVQSFTFVSGKTIETVHFSL